MFFIVAIITIMLMNMLVFHNNCAVEDEAVVMGF